MTNDTLFYHASVVREAGELQIKSWRTSLQHVHDHFAQKPALDAQEGGLYDLTKRLAHTTDPGGEFWYTECSRLVTHFLHKKWRDERALMCAAA